MILVYVAGKFRGPTGWDVACHIHEAELVGIEVAKRGQMPVIPHSMTGHFDGTCNDQFWLDGTMELLRACRAVALVHNWRDSQGAWAEVKEAMSIGLPIYQFHPLTPADLELGIQDGNLLGADALETKGV